MRGTHRVPRTMRTGGSAAREQMTRELRSLGPRRSRHVHSVAGSARNPLLPQEDSLHSSSTDLARCAREIAASLRSALVVARYADSTFGLVSENRSALCASRMQSPSKPLSRLRTPVSLLSESRELSLVCRSPRPGSELLSLPAPNYEGLFLSGSALGQHEGSRPSVSDWRNSSGFVSLRGRHRVQERW